MTHPPITFVASHARLGGQVTHLVNLLRALDPALVRGVIMLEDGPTLPELRAAATDVRVVPTGARAGLVSGVLRLRKVLRATGAQLVHADGTKAAICAALATAGTGVPVIWMRLDGAFDGRVARAVAARCAAVVGISDSMVTTFDDTIRTPVYVVRSGIPYREVDRTEAARALRSAIGAPADAEVVLQVARIVANKGQRDLVEAAAAVCAARPRARFVLVGVADSSAPGYADDVRDLVRGLGLQDRVSLLGRVPDSVQLIAGADLLAVPSLQLPGFYGWREGYSLVTAEAMMVGTPVVAYADPAVVETLDGCGTIVPSGNVAALGRAVTALLAEPQRRAALAESGYRRSRELRLDRAVAELRDVYRDVARRT